MANTALKLVLLCFVVSRAVAVCPEHSFVDPLATSFPPFIRTATSGFKTKDILTLDIAISSKYDHIELDFDGAINDQASLNPNGGPGNWNIDNADPCWTNYSLVIPWIDFNTGGQGGLTLHDGGLMLSFSGVLVVEMHEAIVIHQSSLTLSRSREVKDKLVFVVQFPKFVDANTTVTTWDSPVDLAAVITQTVGTLQQSNPKAYMTIELATVLQAPFKYNVTSMELSVDNIDLEPNLTGELVVDCLDEFATCEQLFRFHVEPQSCNAHGIFLVNINLMCQESNPSICPLDEPTKHDTIEFEITPANFCPQTIQSVSIFAHLNIFQDAQHLVHKDDFLHGQTAFFVATAGSNEATVSTATIIEVRAYGPSVPIFYTPSSPASHPLLQFNMGPPSGDEAYFSFNFHPLLFVTPPGGSMTSSIHVTLRVEFANNALLADTNRHIMQRLLANTEVRNLDISEEVKIENNDDLDYAAIETSNQQTVIQTAYPTAVPSTDSKTSSQLTTSFVALLSVFLFCVGLATGFGASKIGSGKETQREREHREPRKSSGIDPQSTLGAAGR